MSDKICEICKNPIDENDETFSCPDCGKEFHKKCWRLTGKCCVNEECRQKAHERKESEKEKQKNCLNEDSNPVYETSDIEKNNSVQNESQIEAYAEAMRRVKREEEEQKKKKKKRRVIIILIILLSVLTATAIFLFVITRCDSCNSTGKEDCSFCNDGKEICKSCNMTGKKKCSNCEGSGFEPCGKCVNGYVHKECPACYGTGLYLYRYEFLDINCPLCNGNGYQSELCTACNGIGHKDKQCSKCNGAKFEGACPTCNGEGKVACWRCNGEKELDCGTCGGSGSIPVDVAFEKLFKK